MSLSKIAREVADPMFATMRDKVEAGEAPMNMVAFIVGTRPVLNLMFGFYETASKDKALGACGALSRALGATESVMVVDGYIRSFHLGDDIRDDDELLDKINSGYRPSEDPASVECLSATAYDADGVPQGGEHRVYHRNDDGSITWDEPLDVAVMDGQLADGWHQGAARASLKMSKGAVRRGVIEVARAVMPAGLIVMPMDESLAYLMDELKPR